MSTIDMSLDDIIDKNSSRRGGRPAPARGGGRAPAARAPARGGRPAAGGSGAARNQRQSPRTVPYARAPGGRAPGGRAPGAGRPASKESDHQSGVSVADLATSKNPLLKVSSESKPNTVAGAICNIVRESHTKSPPNIMATGPAAINQAIKAIAIARKYLLDEEQPIDLLVEPTFEQDIRQGSNVVFKLEKSEPISREPSETDLSCKDRTDYTKLAGAISNRVRDGEEVALTVKGPVPVLVSIKAIAQAQTYLTDDGVGIKFAVQFRDLEDPDLGNTPSTYLHMAIMPDA